jgi:hypothetical protein
MKTLLTLILGLFCTISVFADCAGAGLWMFPNNKTINQNSIFVLTGYAESQHVIVALNTKHPVYLKSGRQKIKLQVSEICIGQFYLTQAILKPETPLEAGLEYILCIDNLPEYEHIDQYNSKTESYEPISYTVSNIVDTNKPELLTQAKELKKTIHYYGCGPAKYVVFSNPAKDSSEIIIKTTVKNLKTRKETTYYIEPDQEVINVGYGMCSGAFTYVVDDEHYEIEFAYMDSSGNLTPWAGERIKFTKPTPENSVKDD